MSPAGARRPSTGGRRAGRLVRALATAVGVLAVGVVPLATPVVALPAPGGSHPSAGSAPDASGPDASGGDHPSDADTPAATPQRDRAVVTLETVTPSVAKAGTDVTLTGSVTAPLTGPLRDATVRVVRGDVAVDTRTALDDWASGRTDSGSDVVTTSDLGDVASGRSTPFTAQVPSESLYSPAPFAALPISVEVVQPGASEPVGVGRTFIPWNNRKEYVPIQVATLLPVTLDADADLFSRDDARRLAAWQRATGPDSRVQRLVRGSDGPGVTLAVDPSVLGPQAIPSGPPTQAGPGSPATGSPTTGTSTAGTPSGTPTGTTPPTTVPGGSGTGPTTTPTAGGTPTASATGGTGGASATNAEIARLGDALVTELRPRTVWALPYADADVAATVGLDPANPVVRDLVNRSAVLGSRLEHPVRNDVVWPVDGLLPAGREAALRTMLAGTAVRRPGAIVVSSRAVTDDSPYTPTARRTATGGTRLLAYDPRLSALLPKRGAASPVLSTQRFLAESLVLLGERAGTARSVLLTAPRSYDPDPAALATFLAAVGDAPWLEPVDAATLVTDRGNDKALPQQKPAAPVASAAPRPVLDAGRLEAMADQRDTLLSVAAVLADGEEFERTYREVLDELASARWRYAPQGWTVLAASVASDVRAATRAIRVVPRSGAVNLLAENGTLSVTVENGLDYEVADIRLRLATTNPRVQIVEQPGAVTIGARSRTNVPVDVAAVAAGKADIRAWLETADGTVIGSSAQIPVTANPIDGAIYWVGGILVVLVLLFGIVRTVLKGTSRVDEIPDIEAVTAAHAAVEREDEP